MNGENWFARNRKPIAYAAGGILGATALHFGFDARAFDGQSIYNMTDSAVRFMPDVGTSLALGRAMEITQESVRPATFGEKMLFYCAGAAAASGLWECVENLSSFRQFYETLHNAAESIGRPEFIKDVFPGKGIYSAADAALNIGLTEAVVACKQFF